MSSERHERHGNIFEACALSLLGIAFLSFALAKGIPALRHDWAWPADHEQFRTAVLDAAAGWTQGGIGAPNPRPSTYLLVPFLLGANALGGPLLALVALLTAIVIAICAGARALVVRETSRPVRIALTAFLLFNPWVYVQLVAGHLGMLLAYGFMGVVIGTAIRPQSRPHTLALASIGALTQIQFGVLGMAIALVRLSAERRFSSGLVVVVCASPMLLGIALDGDYLRGVPIIQAWETTQSVDLRAAIVLSGYFTHYEAGIEPWAATLVAIVVLLAISALARFERDAAVIAVFLALAGAILIMSGSKGPFSPLYAEAFRSFVPVRAFRELYDLAGLVALGYTFLAARAVAPRKFPLPALLLALAFPAVWIAAPPSRFWLSTSELPAATIPDVASGTRIALLPAFQPMMFQGRGSGADPDYYRALQREPVLNQYFPDEAVAAAFSAYAHGDAKPLRTLAVSAIVTREWLHADRGALSAQGLALPLRFLPAPSLNGNVASIIALIGKPRVKIDPSVGDGGIFLTDAGPMCGACARAMRIVRVPRNLGDPTASWVDVADAIVPFPRMWQPVGGAMTASKLPLMLRAPRAERLLVRVEGRLMIDGNVAKTAPATYAWIPVARGAHRLVCAGTCSVVGTVGGLPSIAPASGHHQLAVSAAWFAPWLLKVTLPKGSSDMLRLLVRYDPHWIALANAHVLTHVAVDSIFNGWLVPERDKVETLLVFNSASGGQTLLELIGLISLLVYAGRFLIVSRSLTVRHPRR